MTSKKYTPQEIARLILFCWHGEVDKQQMTELEEWLEESADNRSFYESLGARSYQGTEWQEYMKYDSRKDWKRVKVAMKRRKRVPFRYLLPYAALVLIAIGLAWMIKYKNTGNLSSLSRWLKLFVQVVQKRSWSYRMDVAWI